MTSSRSEPISDTGSTTPSIRLPMPDGTRQHRLQPRSPVHDFVGSPPGSRIAYAAAHVVADPSAGSDLTGDGRCDDAIDWESTLAFRRHLWSLGLGVADAMDTAQRGGGLAWSQARELISRSGAEAKSVGGALACGAATDQLLESGAWTLGDVVTAYVEQAAWIDGAGGTPVLMASRQLAGMARSSDDYLEVYGEVLRQVDAPVMLHWLGGAFDPAMHSYWGSADLDSATETMLDIILSNADVISGIKVSLLDADREVAMRRLLPAGVRMFTGDDFNYDVLIRGDEQGHSDALLGVFDAIAAPARAALACLDEADVDGYSALMAPTVVLARHLFSAPTSGYKTGVVFLAWLNGHQDHFIMLDAAQRARSVRHLTDLFVLADEAGALAEPELAVRRMQAYLAVAGLEG